MAVVGSLVAYGIYRVVGGRSPLNAPRRTFAAALAGYVSINVAAFLAAIEFGIQPLLFTDPNGVPLYSFYPLSVAIPAMMIGHLTFAGLAEAIITGGVVAYLQRADPSLLRMGAPKEAALDGTAPTRGGSWKPLAVGLLILAILSPLGLLASGTAWGEWGADEVGAEQIGFHLRELNDADRTALAGELTRLGGATADPDTARDLRAAGELLGGGDQAGATAALDPRIDTLRGADAAQYPRVAALAASVREPTGLQQWSEIWKAPIPDYAPGFLKNPVVGYIISALIGLGLFALIATLITRLVSRRRGPAGSET